MVQKTITLEKPLTDTEKHKYSRALAENNNVKRVVFQGDQVIVDLYTRTPVETFMEVVPKPDGTAVVSVD